MQNRFSRIKGVCASILLLVATWYVLYYVHSSPLFPPPHAVIYALIHLVVNHNLLTQLALTTYRVLLGLTLGTVLGLGVGVAVLLSKVVKNAVYPIIAFIAVTPAFAFIPLLMLWVGLNELLPISVVVICTGPPLAYALVSGSKAIDPNIVDAALTLGASRKILVFKVVLPMALTHVLSMLKFELSHGWRLVFVTEYLAISSGLGYLMVKAYSLIKVDEILALIIVLGTLALSTQYLVEKLESRVLSKWGYAKTSSEGPLEW